ncbi:MAG TPA: glycoside hydrolase family 13 protein [Lentimicrobium sp.]|nr:glycoside hydrolase family 13 protein [Lentimicrobium sp.]
MKLHPVFKTTSALLIFSLVIIFKIYAQPSGIRIDPPFWWKGMQNNNLQLMVYASNIGACEVQLNYPGIKVLKVHQVENPNYLFIDLELDKDVKPGVFNIVFTQSGKRTNEYKYELREREQGSAARKGFGTEDIIYLLMPDRFANGDPGNDDIPEMLEKAGRSNPSGRHGGDIKGITDHLDYIKDLGATAIWINPLLENNNGAFTYHGYAITDFYRIDPRFGNNEDYLDLVDQAHKAGLKVIKDMVLNHCGINNWFIKDLPMKDWIHQFPQFTKSNFRAEAITDNYSTEIDRNTLLQGWFDTNMPDLDQRNPFILLYLIQNSIWWIEYSGIDGIRLDTQPYSYKEMVAEWARRIFEEYPDFNIVGEAWMQRESMTSYYQKDSKLRDTYNSNIPSVTDFPMHNAISKGFTEPEGWTEGMSRIYYVLAQDFLYENPFYNLIFADNHDLNRFYSTIKKDLNAWKLAMTFLMTTRGIPMIYYGTEFLMEGEEHKGHGEIRKDFPGGWKGDSLDYFTGKGRTTEQSDAFNYLKKIMNWRSTSDPVISGTLKHFIPSNGVYVYFREKGDKRVMVILNNSEKSQALETSHFAECLRDARYGLNVLTGEKFTFRGTILVEPRSALIIQIDENNKYPY